MTNGRPLPTGKKAELEQQLSQLTSKIHNHKGTNVQLERLRRRRKLVSKALFDENVCVRNALLRPARVLEQFRIESGLPKEADHALQIAVELFKVASVDEIEYVNRRVDRHTH